MRKLIAVEWLSLDGVMEAPEEWAFSYTDDELEAAHGEARAESDALLFGRVTYDGMAAFWSNQPPGTPMVDHINAIAKFVVSETLHEPLEWNNSSLIRGTEFAERVTELKQQPGKNITILGSGVLVRSLLEEGLVDELRLLVHPVVLGGGKRLFEEGIDGRTLKLAQTQAFPSGVVRLIYEPAAG
jgi:dihydrofolate reductase